MKNSGIANVIVRTLRDGGGTFNVHTLEPIEDPVGYSVGGLATESFGDCTLEEVQDRIATFLVNRVAGLSEYLGTWIDPETNLWHLDAVEIIEDRDEAIEAGRKRGEIAIFDFGTFEDIRL